MLLVVGLWLGAIARVDMHSRRIPNAMVWPGGVAVVVSAGVHPEVLTGGAVATVGYVVAFLLHQCGGGDVKLAFVLGAMVGRIDAAVAMVVVANLLQIVAHILRMRGPAVQSGAGTAHAPALFGGMAVALWLTP